MCAFAGVNICAHVLNPVVLCQSLVDYGNTKIPSMYCRMGSATVAAGFPQGKQPLILMGEIPMGQYNCKKKKSLKAAA